MRDEQVFFLRSADRFLTISAGEIAELSPEICQRECNLAVDLDAISCLPLFPNLKKLVLRPGELNDEMLDNLRDLKIEALKLDYYSDEFDAYTLDLSWFPSLQLVISRTSRNFKNAGACKSLQTVVVQDWLERDLNALRGSSIAALMLLRGKLRSLQGIEDCGLRSLSVSYQPKLADLSGIKDLESLEIDHCAKVEIDLLPAMPRLEYLALYGSQTVQSLAFLRRFPNLKYFLFDVLIADGRLEPLKNLSHCVSLVDRRHYSLKNSALPKSDTLFRSSTIPFRLEILPGAGRG